MPQLALAVIAPEVPAHATSHRALLARLRRAEWPPMTETLDAAAVPQPEGGDGNLLMAISNEMVRLYKQQFGRGPTAARTMWAGPDVLVVVLESTLTPAERNLVRLGEHERLRETRLYFQYASVAEFCEAVERLTGRTVRSFISGTDSEVDGLSVETFVLWPENAEDVPSRIELIGRRGASGVSAPGTRTP